MNTATALEIIVEYIDENIPHDNKFDHAVELLVSQYRVAMLREANKDVRLAALEAENAKLRELIESIDAMNDEDMGEWAGVSFPYLPVAFANRAHIRDAIAALDV